MIQKICLFQCKEEKIIFIGRFWNSILRLVKFNWYLHPNKPLQKNFLIFWKKACFWSIKIRNFQFTKPISRPKIYMTSLQFFCKNIQLGGQLLLECFWFCSYTVSFLVIFLEIWRCLGSNLVLLRDNITIIMNEISCQEQDSNLQIVWNFYQTLILYPLSRTCCLQMKFF